MNQLNPKWVEFVKRFVNSSPYLINQNIKLLDLKYGESFLEVELNRIHLQGYGYVHGGVYSALVDSAGFFAVYTQVEGDNSAATIEMNLNYLFSVKTGKLLAHGRCLNLGKSIGLAEVTIRNEEETLLAYGSVTVMVKPPLKSLKTVHLPSKFSDSI
ncbi:MAG: PaaI family thioesterase [Candidatus Hodarchaeota archaeon]